MSLTSFKNKYYKVNVKKLILFYIRKKCIAKFKNYCRLNNVEVRLFTIYLLYY